MKDLQLVLKGVWYDMIEAGVKLEEYRELKPFWIRRLLSCGKECGGLVLNGEILCPACRDLSFAEYDTVTFHYGYTSRTMKFAVKSIRIGRGNQDWGAPEEDDVFIISLGKRIS